MGKSFSNKDCANNILRSMRKEWQQKVTAIKEPHDLNNLDITKLFGKLSKYKNEFKWIIESEVI